jgi:hypothetical protein
MLQYFSIKLKYTYKHVFHVLWTELLQSASQCGIYSQGYSQNNYNCSFDLQRNIIETQINFIPNCHM